MSLPLSVVPALLVAAVLVAGGIAKLRRPDDASGWAEMGVPTALRRPALIRLHPWGEIALGGALLALGGLPGAAAALVAAALMAVYLVLVVRVVRRVDDASCACFGARRVVTRVTVVRNSWYLALSVVALGTTWSNPTWGGPLAGAGPSGAGWIVGLAAVAITVAVTLWPEQPTTSLAIAAPAPSADHDLLDYIPTRTPAVPVVRADGVEINLRALSMTQPLLLLAVTPGCVPCAPVFSAVAEWRALLPEVSVRLLFSGVPEGNSATEYDEPQSLHDPHHYVRDSIADWGTPTAVLLGGDGMLAGGPVTGYDAIESFIDDIYESLHGERPNRADAAAS